MRIYSSLDTQVGKVFAVAENDRLSAVYIGEEDFHEAENVEMIRKDMKDPFLRKCILQLEEYFDGSRNDFDLALEQSGTEFQQEVWNVLGSIPYGVTKSYQEVAEDIGRPKAVRAVGQANKANRLPIVIPCHRVIGKNQTLTGYAGSRTDIKKKLLELEGAAFKNVHSTKG